MTRGRAAAAAAFAGVTFFLGWLLFFALPRWYGEPAATQVAPAAPSAAPAPSAGRRIKARLFFVSDDGTRLKAVERDVAYGEGALEQARQIVEAQIAPAADPLVCAVPKGTKLRALFITERGEAYVDLSRDVAAAHSGGTLDELLTTYTIVNALTANLPAVTAVQILVEGKEVDTLAGHVDIRRPLASNSSWIE